MSVAQRAGWSVAASTAARGSDCRAIATAQIGLLEKGDGSPLDVGKAELAGGGEGLAEEIPGALGVTALLTGEEHPGPLEAGAGQPGGSTDAGMG